MSALLDALARAESYRKTDYTESSYNDLKDAVDDAKNIISDPNATQDEIDEALLNIENSIGMLKLINDIPSGAEGYGVSGDTDMNGGINNGVSGEADVSSGGQGEQHSDGENAGSVNDVQAAQDGNIANPSDGSQPYGGDPFTENGESSKSPVLKMIVIAVVAAIAAVAAMVFLKILNKKKS